MTELSTAHEHIALPPNMDTAARSTQLAKMVAIRRSRCTQ
jgi:hypothetical protein